MVKKTPAYKNRLRALELEHSGGTVNKKKSNKQMDKYENVVFVIRNWKFLCIVMVFQAAI